MTWPSGAPGCWPPPRARLRTTPPCSSPAAPSEAPHRCGRIARVTSDDDVAFEPRRGDTDAVLFARQGRLGRIRLNRPRAINALTHPMVTAMLAQLQDWAGDDAVTAVSVEGAGARGLCA